MTKKTASQAILELLAHEDRRVLSDWRATLLLRRATTMTDISDRRWLNLPTNVSDIYPLLRQMKSRGQIRRILDLPNLYEVTVPYARTGIIEEDEILMEVHPYATLSHFSALDFHNLTHELPKEIVAMIPTSGTGGMLPLGTDNNDWEGLVLVRGQRPKHILNRPVHWIRTDPSRYFGISEFRPRGYPVRVTTVERTLIDGLQKPQLCGGIENVLRAWMLSRDFVDLEQLTQMVDLLDINVLRQRVGFILEELHIQHPAIDTWSSHTRRGGSSKLLGSAPYSSTFSPRWNLSINYPVSVLHEDLS